MKKKFITQGRFERSCFYSAVSTLRIALGYKRAYPRNVPRPEITKIKFIVNVAKDLFPYHEVVVVCEDYLREYARGYIGSDLREVKAEKYLWMFDYSTHAEGQVIRSSGGLWQSHIVIGLPHYHEGMFGSFCIGVKVR